MEKEHKNFTFVVFVVVVSVVVVLGLSYFFYSIANSLFEIEGKCKDFTLKAGGSLALSVFLLYFVFDKIEVFYKMLFGSDGVKEKTKGEPKENTRTNLKTRNTMEGFDQRTFNRLFFEFVDAFSKEELHVLIKKMGWETRNLPNNYTELDLKNFLKNRLERNAELWIEFFLLLKIEANHEHLVEKFYSRYFDDKGNFRFI